MSLQNDCDSRTNAPLGVSGSGMLPLPVAALLHCCIVASGGGKSGLYRAGYWLTARRGDPTESAAESRPPICDSITEARVKR